MSPRFIVVFKKSASQETIDRQADDVNQSGGSVKNRFNSIGLKGFSAEIPQAYLSALESSLTQADSQIDYIEPDSVVTTQ